MLTNLQNNCVDPYYLDLFNAGFNDQFITDAGYFDDERSYSDIKEINHSFLSTPVSKIIDNISSLKSTDKLAVLMITGAFAPIHQGHLDTLTAARKALELKGYTVVGAYITPDHDDYVSTKHENALSAHMRLHYAHLAVADSTWIDVDPWASLVYDRSANFTTLLTRLEQYLEIHVQQNVTVFAVYGGDNAHFSAAFTHRGHGICVTREGRGKNIYEEDWFNKERVIVTEGLSTLSSTSVRSNSTLMIPALSRAIQNDGNDTYLLRNDLKFALPFLSTIEHKNISDGIQTLIAEHTPKSVNTVIVNVEDQLASFNPQHKTLSLDVFYHGDENLDTSRVFHLSAGQVYSQRMEARPGSVDLQNQVNNLPEGEYILVDDDICTGYTLKNILNLLPSKINIISTYAFMNALDTHAYKVYDVADMRDFIIGAQEGGLVTTLPNDKIARVPYLFPYVNSVTRLKIPPKESNTFNKKLWELNQTIHESSGLRLYDLQEQDLALWKYLHFKMNMKLSDLARWHLKQW